MSANLPDLQLALTSDIAAAEGLPVWLLRGQILVESGGNPFAIRYEPDYPYLWDVLKDGPWTPAEAPFPSYGGCSSLTELTAQKTSWGLLQVMGAVARERGYTGIFLSGLCDSGVGLRIGAGLLKELLTWAGGDQPQALGAYNAGRKHALGPDGQVYAAKVIAAANRLEHGL